MTAAPRGDDQLTLHEAAEQLGVHYMTAYRYVRNGRLTAKQVNGAWQVRRSSLDALKKPRASGRVKQGTTPSRRHYVLRLTKSLVQGDEAEAWRVVQQALVSAFTPEALYLDVLGPALHRVGDEWAAGRLSVADEHRASAVMSRLIGRLGPSFIRPGRKRGRVVLGAPANDHHALATALVSDVLRGRGFTVIDLGAHTPADSFVDAINGAGNLVGTGMVVSTPMADPALAATIAAIKAADDGPVLLGGVAIRDSAHAFELGADAWSNSARDAADWFDAAV